MYKNKNPILVTGSHRSGTTWIGKTISKNSRIQYIQEPFNVSYPNKSLGLKLNNWFTHAESSDQKEEIVSSFNNLLHISPIKSAIEKCKSDELGARSILRFSKHFALALLRPRILVKDPLALLSAGWLHETYDFHVICMIRNPFAFVNSVQTAGWDFDFSHLQQQDGLMSGLLSQFSQQIDMLCENQTRFDFIDRATILWTMLNTVVLTYQKQYPDWLFVRHEDIATAPHEGFERIFNHLELPLSRTVLRYIDMYTSNQNLKAPTSVFYQPRTPQSTLYAWKQQLSSRDISRIRASTADVGAQLYPEMF